MWGREMMWGRESWGLCLFLEWGGGEGKGWECRVPFLGEVCAQEEPLPGLCADALPVPGVDVGRLQLSLPSSSASLQARLRPQTTPGSLFSCFISLGLVITIFIRKY